MRRVVPLYIVLYIAVFLLLGGIAAASLMTQYVWGEPFYDFVGPMVIRGSQINATARQEASITRAAVEYRGFVFNFDRPLRRVGSGIEGDGDGDGEGGSGSGSGIDGEGAGGSGSEGENGGENEVVRSYHRIQSYRKQRDALTLYFTGNIQMRFHFGKADELLVTVLDGDGEGEGEGDDDGGVGNASESGGLDGSGEGEVVGNGSLDDAGESGLDGLNGSGDDGATGSGNGATGNGSGADDSNAAAAASAASDYLVFAYRCPQDRCQAERRIITIADRDHASYLYLPTGAVSDRSHIRISLHNPVRTFRFSSVYTPGRVEELDAISTRFLEQASLTLPELRAQFIRRAYDNWNLRSYLVAEGQWLTREGNPHFTEEIMIANLAEAILQDDYTRTFNAMRRAYQQNAEATTIHSVPYVGDSFARIAAFAESERARENTVQQIAALASTTRVAPPLFDTLFDSIDLLSYLHFRAPAETHRLLSQHIHRHDYFTLNTHQLLNLLQYLLFDIEHPDRNDRTDRNEHPEHTERNRVAIEEIITNRIIPLVFATQNSVFIRDTENSVGFHVTIWTASILRQFALSTDDAPLARIADALEHSALNFADDNSYLPQYATLQGDRIASVHGFIDPAETYPYIADAAPYSRFASLDTERRLWMMSAIDLDLDLDLQQTTPDTIELTARSPLAHNFYIVIGNTPRPRQVQIAGASSPLDPAFQTRIRGWYWFSAHNILVINFHRSDQSTRIVIQY